MTSLQSTQRAVSFSETEEGKGEERRRGIGPITAENKRGTHTTKPDLSWTRRALAHTRGNGDTPSNLSYPLDETSMRSQNLVLRSLHAQMLQHSISR
ncbi:hypothetical protein KM043_005755 [Ampulex compressa]|nr:hypothetical protein KM043_005755 [Ampulex compressa]